MEGGLTVSATNLVVWNDPRAIASICSWSRLMLNGVGAHRQGIVPKH